LESIVLTAARRALAIEPFYVMEIVKAAAALEAVGRSVLHLSIGEPDFTAPACVLDAAKAALDRGQTGYTAAAGLTELREAISAHYADRFGVDVPAERIFVTAGASAALLIAFAAVLESGAEVLMPDPCYPCNRHFAAVLGARARMLPAAARDRFQLTAEAIAGAWRQETGGVLLASPSNPTGTSIAPAELARVAATVRTRKGFLIIDEIYQGLTYDTPPSTALALGEDVIVINSFSKYFSMTGWRLGWLVVPPSLAGTIEKLAQNLFICASAVAQRAALACFSEAALRIYESRRAEFVRRRAYLLPALRELGFEIPTDPDGAFYMYADIGRFARDSWDFSFNLLERTGVCVVPGRDFSIAAPERYVRISYATSMARLEEAVERMRGHLGTPK
jgi:aspartate/methionine/tyrosine aminotransferase